MAELLKSALLFLCKHNKFGFVGVFEFCRIQYLHLTREVDFAKQKTEGEIARALLPLSLAYGKPAPLTSGATPFFSF